MVDVRENHSRVVREESSDLSEALPCSRVTG